MNREVHVQFWEGVGLRCPALLNYLKAYDNVAQARQGIAAYFEFYNHQRLHQALATWPTGSGGRVLKPTISLGSGRVAWLGPRSLISARVTADD